MLDCQKETKSESMFICKKLADETGFKDFLVHESQCSQCQKSNDQDTFILNMLDGFYIRVISTKQMEANIEKAKDYILKNIEKREILYKNISNLVVSLVCGVSYNLNQIENKEYCLNNLKKLRIEKLNKLINNEEEQYKCFKDRILEITSTNKTNAENHIKQMVEILYYKKDIVQRLIEEEKNIFSEDFLKTIEKSFKEQDKNITKIKKDPNFKILPKVSIFDKIKGAKLAFQRIKDKAEKDGKEALWVDEKEIIERQVCCTTCTDGNSCPYCGCQIKKSWFLPLGKSELTTEGCPNLNTYPHLKNFPTKNYWEVCNEKTSVLIAAKNEEHLNKTILDIIQKATGEIEVLVGLDEYKYDVIEDKVVTVLKFDEHLGRRAVTNKLAQLATGKYIFEIDAHCAISYGWDTKLKCVCDENTIVGCSVNSINEDTWQGDEETKWVGGKISEEVRWNWDKINDENLEKIEEVESFNSCGWMIRKDYFDKLGGHDEELGEWGWENIEWTLKNKINEGKMIIRTDVVVSHLFRKEYPYDIKGKEYDEIIKILKNKNYL